MGDGDPPLIFTLPIIKVKTALSAQRFEGGGPPAQRGHRRPTVTTSSAGTFELRTV